MATPPIHLTARRGFTLIELLTVIAIIGVLAAILIPVVGKVRESAQAATTVSNLRQLQTANLAYASDNKNTLMPNLPGGWTSNGWPWFCWSKFYAYAGLRMPDSSSGIQLRYAADPSNGYWFLDWDMGYPKIAMTGKPITYPGKLPGCYTIAMNTNLDNGGVGTRIGVIRNPTRLIVFGEAANWELGSLNSEWGAWTSDDAMSNGLAFRYGGKAHVAYADGHVGAVQRKHFEGLSTAAKNIYFQP